MNQEEISKLLPDLDRQILTYASLCEGKDKQIKILQIRIAALEVNNKRLRFALEEIHSAAHCIAKAGPFSTPTLEDAWPKFDHIAVMATAALAEKEKLNETH